jgi:hypothetical protein
METIRTDFSGYEGKYMAIDLRTGQAVMADDDYNRLADCIGTGWVPRKGPWALSARVGWIKGGSKE